MDKTNIPILKGEMDPITQTSYKEVQIPKDYFSQIHSHSFFEIMLIKKGQLIHHINGHEFKVAPDTLLFIRPDDIHHLLPDQGRTCTLVNLEVSSKVIEDLFAYLGPGFDRAPIVTPQLPPQRLLTKLQAENISSQLTKIHYQNHWDKLKSNFLLRNLLFELVGLLHLPNQAPDGYPLWLKDLLEEMQKPVNFRGGIQRMQILSGKSREHLSRTLKKHLNLTPSQYINNLKLNYCVNLLRYTDKSIIDISFESGFDNPHYFHRLFLRQFGVSPSRYRQRTNQSKSPG